MENEKWKINSSPLLLVLGAAILWSTGGLFIKPHISRPLNFVWPLSARRNYDCDPDARRRLWHQQDQRDHLDSMQLC
jgi:hypothetical protein